MPLDTTASWRELASAETLDFIKANDPPDTWDQCRNNGWEEVLTFYCEQNYCDENLRFLLAVADYQTEASVAKAEEIIEKLIYGDAPLNLYDDSSGPINEWYRDEDHVLDTTLFDRARREVVESFSGTYGTFKASVQTAKRELAGQDDAPEPEIEVSAPKLQEFDRAHVDMAVVDNWNQQALKELDQGAQTPFLQFEDLVLIKHPTASAAQPYWAWASTQDWAAAGAYVKMEKKGGAFDPGRIKVVGARPGETNWFEKAVARVSKKKVVF